MPITKAILLLLSITAVFSQGLGDNLDAKKAGCKLHEILVNGKCVFSPTSALYKPCGNRKSCGMATNFQSKSQLIVFRDRSTLSLRTQAQGGVRNAALGNLQINFLVRDQTQPSSRIQSNNQVQGIDQADLLKSEGSYIYTVSGNYISIVLAFPYNDARLTWSNKLNFTPKALFVVGKYMAVFGGSSAQTNVHIYNTQNKANPVVIKEFSFSGKYFDGRKLMNGFIYLVSTEIFNAPWYDFGQGRTNVAPQSIFKYPEIYQSFWAANVIAFKLSNPLSSQTNMISLVIPENITTIYMSQKNIYLTYNSSDYTTIKKIQISQKQIVPFGDGSVKGSLISINTVSNQFWMDEYNGFFRIVTTNKNSDNQFIDNNVYVLDYNLAIFGSLSGIAPKKRIYAARFYGDRCFLICFQHWDPLYVIDLRVLSQPKVYPQLKIQEMVSRYLHIYDQNTVIGLGRQIYTVSPGPNGERWGPVAISIFDVTDPTNLLVTAKYLDNDGLQTLATAEHKSFLFSRQKNILAIPGDSPNKQFKGTVVFEITPSSIIVQDTINHVENGDYWLSGDVRNQLYNVERCVILDDYIYSKSRCMIKMDKLYDSILNTKTIQIGCQERPNPNPNPRL